jgi:PKD repeat protein
MKTKTSCFYALILLAFVFSVLNGFAINHEVSKYLINLSEGEEGPGYNDKVPEMVISGNTIHVVWVQSPPSYEDVPSLFYCRSTDLGETWEAPQLIKKFKDTGIPSQLESRRLAVDGENVHICAADYDHGDNGIGKLYYFRSQNGGASFESERIIAATSGGYKSLDRSFIKASNGKVVIAYRGQGDKNGVWALFSSNGGSAFTETKLSDESSYVADLYYDGDQMIVLHGDYSTSYGYITVGKVWVSQSQNGTAFTTSKISVTYMANDVERERCYVVHGDHYSSKIAKSGNNIHVLFTGYANSDAWATFYARSTNGGNSFETAIELSSLFSETFQNGSETVAAKNGNVYFLVASTYPTNNNAGNHFYFLYSHNNGETLSEPRRIMNPDVNHVGKSSLPAIVIDPTDETGKTLYLTGNWLFSTKSVDGGETFSGSTSLAPFLKSNIINMSHNYMKSYMQTDAAGGLHWISLAIWRDGNDKDIFYRNVKAQPEPGSENKAFYVENIEETREKTDLVVVPSSESIQFDSAMTAEVWVKFNPATKTSKFSILAKMDGYDGYDNRPQGYHMGFRHDDGAIYVNAGIQTDKDDPVNFGEIDLNDNLWHHIAFTYDANGGLNNFKLYINGLLHQQTTLTGAIVKEDGMLMLGARNMGSGWYDDAKYYMDDVRLWDRALTQEELLENQTKNLTGEEEGLTLFINFDDTFKDITGNGNDGIPVYYGALQQSDFDPPLTGFEIYQTGNTVSLNNKTENATSWLWDFGDENTSEQGNPKYTYSTAGEYTISLLAKNTNNVTGAVGHATIKGLDRVEPKEAGNIGECLLTVFGGGLNANMDILLRYDDNTEIVADTVAGSGEEGFLQAVFTLTGAETGQWDVVVLDQGNEMVLSESFKIKQAEGFPEPWVNVSGRGYVLFNRWNKYTLTYGNNGDIDALMVPVSFAIPDVEGLEVELVDFEFVLPQEAYDYNLEEELMPYKDYFVTDTLFGKPQKSKVYSLMIPRIKAKSSESLHIRIKSPEDYIITSWTGDGWLQYADGNGNALIGEQLKSGVATAEDDSQNGASAEVGSCIMEALAVTTIETSIGIIPGVGAVYNSFKTGYTAGQFAENRDVKKTVVNTSLQAASTFFSYASVVPVVGWVTGTIGGLVCGGISAYYAVSDCLSLEENEKGVGTVASLDPNEIIGPDGFGNKGWISKLNELPYTIFFENKADATAPAHDVFIADTLDLTAFDISNFGFGAFGWGDTIFSPPGNELKEFSMDIDLRPELELITRVSGKLDTVTGIVKWEFLSLNPETMELEEDPFVGFLPPNVNSPEGEGFVSYSVGLKEELSTNDEIRNKASIVFDANEPIITNEYLNTLDMDVPQSQIYPLEANIDSRFPVDWTGSDEGSGIRHYTIYVLENDTLLYPWLTNTTEITAEFIGEVGSSYKFYSIATDNVSHIEAAPNDYDAQTTVTVDVEEFERMKETLSVWPNPVKDNLQVTFSNAPCGMYVVELVSATGSVKHSQLYEDRQLQNGISVNVLDCPAGQYVLRVVFGNRVETRKVVVN